MKSTAEQIRALERKIQEEGLLSDLINRLDVLRKRTGLGPYPIGTTEQQIANNPEIEEIFNHRMELFGKDIILNIENFDSLQENIYTIFDIMNMISEPEDFDVFAENWRPEIMQGAVIVGTRHWGEIIPEELVSREISDLVHRYGLIRLDESIPEEDNISLRIRLKKELKDLEQYMEAKIKDIQEISYSDGYFARMTMPGYSDHSNWSGRHESENEAINALRFEQDLPSIDEVRDIGLKLLADFGFILLEYGPPGPERIHERDLG